MYLQIADRQTDPQTLLSARRTIITIGRTTDETYNVIAIDDPEADTFQCQLKQSADGWTIQNGQWRTECPKGIRSQLQHACSMCMGRCVNPRPANPKYSWRMPQKPTLVNNREIHPDGQLLHIGDSILCGHTTIEVKE